MISAGVETGGANLFILGHRVMFREIVSFVETAAFPIDIKLALADAITNPIKVHVNSLGALLLDGGVCDARSSTVVGDNCG